MKISNDSHISNNIKIPYSTNFPIAISFYVMLMELMKPIKKMWGQEIRKMIIDYEI